MLLKDLLDRERILVPLEATSLRGALEVLLRVLIEREGVADPVALERLASDARLRDVVAIGDHVVLPHFRTDGVDRLTVALGISNQPLEARDAGLDIRPRAVVLILAPPEAATLYLQTIAALARLFRQDGVIERLLDARSADEVLALPELQSLRIQPRLTVRDIMMHRVESVAPDSPVRDAVDIMVRNRVRAIPVVGEKREVLGIVSEGKLTGFLTRGDIIRKLFGR